MINIKDFTSLDISYNNAKRKILISDSVRVEFMSERSLEQMRDVVLNENLTCPDIFYTSYLSVSRYKDIDIWTKGKYTYDITIMQSNLAGIEYIKTYGHYNISAETNMCDQTEVIEILYGGCIALIQKPLRIDENNFDYSSTEEINLLKLGRHDKILIPKGYAVTLINNKSNVLIFGSFGTKKRKSYTSPLSLMHGMSYYIIRKNARTEIVKNSNYTNVSKIKKPKLSDFNDKITSKILKTKKSVYLDYIKNQNKFDSLF